MMEEVRRPRRDRMPDSFKGRVAAVEGSLEEEEEEEEDVAVGMVSDARVSPGNIPSSAVITACPEEPITP